jgi:PAS domain S-box-containing protein
MRAKEEHKGYTGNIGNQKSEGNETVFKKERQVLLIIEDEEVSNKLEYAIHEKFGFEVETVKNRNEALERIDASPWQYDVAVIYVDLNDKRSGLESLKEIKKKYPEIEVIYIINSDKKDTDDAWPEGAFNCFVSPINFGGIAYAVKFARDQAQFRRERKMLDRLQELSVAVNSATEFHEIQNLACKAAVEILNSDHSGLLLFEKDLSKGKLIAEYPEPQNFLGTEIKVKGIPLEEKLVYQREVINIPDLANCKDLGEVQEKLMKLKIRSLLIVPVIQNNKVIASFSIDMIEKNRVFYQDEEEVCKKLANQVAAVIGKDRYFNELSVLKELSRDISTGITLDIEKIFALVRKHAGKLIDAKNFFIALWDEEKRQYSVPYHIDERDDRTSFPPEKQHRSLTDYVRKTQQSILANSHRILELRDKGEIDLIGTPTKIWLGAPIISRNKVHGVLVVQDYENENTYDYHDLTVLQTIASQLAIAIDNFQLIKNERRRIRDLEIVNSIVHTISTKLNPDDLFQTMVTQIANNLNCTHCTLFLQKEIDGESLLVPQKTHGLHENQIMSRRFKPGEGLAGWVFKNSQSLVLPDARTDSRYSQTRKRKNLPHSILVAPIIVGIRTIGVISADKDEYNGFSKNDRQLVNTLTRHAGIAIERALGLNLLQEIGIELISSEDEEKILQRIISGAIDLTNTSSGILYLISEDGESIIKKFPYPPDSYHPEPRLGKEIGFTREIIKSGKMIKAQDTLEDNRFYQKRLKDVRAMIGIPLKIGEKVVGVLYLNAKEPRFFTETEISLLEILAGQAAIAIYNSSLYRKAQRQVSEIETLYETSQEIAREYMNIKSVLETFLEKAVQLSNADSAHILFRDEDKNKIKLFYNYGFKQFKGISFGLNEGIAAKVFESGEPDYTNDYHNHPNRAKIFDEPQFRDLFNSMAVVPLKWQGDVIGVITLTSTRNFTDDDVHLLERFSSTAAITIATARELSFRQTLLNNSPDAIVAIDKKGAVKEFNKASEQIFGYTKDKVLNKSIVDLWGERKEAGRINHLLHDSKNGTVRDIEAFVTKQSGEKIPVLFSGSILYSEGYGKEREEIGIIGQFEDERIVSLRGRTRRLLEAIKKINRAAELPELLDVILHRAIGLLDAESGYIMLPKGDFFEVVESHHIDIKQAVAINLKMNKEIVAPLIEKDFPKPLSSSYLYNSGIPVSRDIKSTLLIPLKIEKDIIGVICVESHSDDYFQEENELLQFLSAEAAVALNRVQLKEESKRLELLKELGAQIRKKGKFSEYKDIIVKTTRKLLHSELSSIFLFQKSDRSLIGQAWYPWPNELKEMAETYREREGITGKILACKENDHIIYNDEKDILQDAVPAYLEKHKCLPSWKNRRHKSTKSAIQHFLAVPIVGEKGKVFGALRVMNKISKVYTAEKPVLDNQGFRVPEDTELLKTIASLLSQALSSERKAEKLTLLREITKEISEKTDSKGIGDCVVQSVVERLGYSACSMRLVKGDKVELISHWGFRSNNITELVIPNNNGLVGKAINTKNAALAYDMWSEREDLNGGCLYKDYAKDENIHSACCVPILGIRDEAIGAIVIYMRQAPYDFTDYEINDNFFTIAATCAIALRKVEAVNHLQKLLEILEWMHVGSTKDEIMEACIKEILNIFDAHAAAIFDTEKSGQIEEVPLINLSFNHLKSINIHPDIKISKEILANMERDKPRIFNAGEFPAEWQSLEDKYSQCLAFTIDFKKETLGIVVLFTRVGVHSILPELEIYKLASAISRQLAIAFKNLEFIDEIARVRAAEPAIISAQYVSGMIHELSSSAHKGKGAITYIRGTPEYKKIKSQSWKIEFSKTESAFDDIGNFTTQALEFKDIAQMKFERTLEYRSINKSIQDVLHDINNEVRKKSANVKWEYDKSHNQKHAYFDEILIKQAIRNLVSNSLRWIPEGGCITITSSQKGDDISILVQDNGRGVEPGTENRIFEPYFTTTPQGYGIGLFFVKNVVKLHKGTVSLVSARNPTIFEIKISSKLIKGGEKDGAMHFNRR